VPALQVRAGHKAIANGHQQIREGHKLIRASWIRYLVVPPLLYLTIRMFIYFAHN